MKHAESAVRPRRRNSNIEALRLVAMGMVLLNHLPWGELNYLDPAWPYARRLALTETMTVLLNWGGVGDCLFFGISAWFLCEERHDAGRTVSRCWRLEKELWFWALLLFAGSLAVWHARGGLPLRRTAVLALRSLFPFASGLWWYPTSYMLFLLACPSLTAGLRALGRRRHATLCIGLLTLYAFVPSRFFPLDMGYSVVLFAYQYALVSFLRWHAPSVCADRVLARRLLVFGLTTGVGSQVLLQLFDPNQGYHWTLWMNAPRCLPSLCVAFGLIVLAVTSPVRHCRVVDALAPSALSVYLVVTSPCADLVLKPWAASRTPGWTAIALNVGVGLVLYAGVIALDLLRRWVFARTVDRRHARQVRLILAWLRRLRGRVAAYGRALARGDREGDGAPQRP